MKIGENSESEQINNQLSVSEQQSSSKMKIKNTSHQTISLGNTAFAPFGKPIASTLTKQISSANGGKARMLLR